ncbi:MAG: hypothetical protein LBP19_03780 [Treponema sp.]|jgi:hypothetical protein|nr:hypothetical protein [Treponema sp.]
MPRANFKGLSKSKDETWKVYYQHHHSSLRIVIPSKTGKYFLIKQNENGSLTIKYYNKILSIGDESYAYSEVLPEICPEFYGNEIEADKFLVKNIDDPRLASLHFGIYGYCIDHNKPILKYNTIEINSELFYCKKEDDEDIKIILNVFCDLVKCSIEDLQFAVTEYMKTDSTILDSEFISVNPTARERSIVPHYPGEKE